MLKSERSVKNFGEAQAEIEKSSGTGISLNDSTCEVVSRSTVTGEGDLDAELPKTASKEFGGAPG